MHRILIIDDLQDIHDDFRRILTGACHSSPALGDAKAGLFGVSPPRKEQSISFEVDHALQGEEGWRRVKAAVASGKRYTVAFVDMRMPPGWNGLQTIKRLWEADADIQVVICTAYSDQSWEEISTAFGLTDRMLILKKPFDPMEVLQLATALSEKWALKHQATMKLDELERLVQLRTRELKHEASHDALTGLPNRSHFRDTLSRVIEQSRTDRSPYVVLFLDFDRFKVVNDSLGHDSGDELLVEIGKRLKNCASSHEFSKWCRCAEAARLGGDEFALVAAGLREAADATKLAEELLTRLAEPYALKGINLTATASIGITSGEMGYASAEEALRDADTAMYHAKAAGRAQFVVFDRPMHEEAMRRLALENELRGAAERNEFLLHYQPVVDLSSGVLVGFEALVRWQHPRKGLVSPGDFIPCAEETGLVQAIGLWVLRNACNQLGHWQRKYPESKTLTLSVNVSARQLVGPGFVDGVQKALTEAGVSATCLALEITETAVITNPETAIQIMKQVRDLGVRIYMDDFGTGYSSLSYLHHLPINAIKMDRTFMESVSERREYAAVVFAIVTLARNLGISVIAEGVEKAEQVAMLQAMECELAQGYLFGRPAAPDEAEEFIVRPRLRMAA